MFFNEFTFKRVAYGDVINPKHYLFKDVFRNSTSGSAYHLIPLLLFIPIVLFQNKFIVTASKIFVKLRCLKSVKNIEKARQEGSGIRVDEKLGTFWSCLSGID